MSVTVIVQDIKKLETEALIVGFYEDVRPLKSIAGELDWLLCGSLSTLILAKKVNGTQGDIALLTSRGKIPAAKIFMIGLGSIKKLTPAVLRTAAHAAAEAALGAGVTRAALEYFPSGGDHGAQIKALREGLREGIRGRRLDIAILAPDAASYETLARQAKA